MATGKWILCSAVVLFSASILVSAEDMKPMATPATQPAEPRAARSRRLTEPWRKLKDLTPEQTDQIEKIHADALVQENKIKEKEKDDAMAVLTPAQVTELKEAEAEGKMKGTAKERRMKKATTEPTG